MRMRGRYLATIAIAVTVGQMAMAEDTSAAIKACRAEPDDSRRLACYDREIDRVQAPAVLTPEEKFGRTGTMTREEADREELETRALGELQASVTEITTRADGLMVVTLDNGQVWRQNRPESFFRLNAGDKVTIQPASMNSFLMTAPSKRSTRVTRLK